MINSGNNRRHKRAINIFYESRNKANPTSNLDGK